MGRCQLTREMPVPQGTPINCFGTLIVDFERKYLRILLLWLLWQSQ